MRFHRAGAVMLLLSLGSACLLGPEVHPDFKEAYGTARVVFIVPPTAAVWAMTGAGDMEYREDLSGRYQERLAAWLRKAVQKRGLKVAEIEATPENGVLVEEVGRRFATTLPAFREADARRRQQAPFTDQSYPAYSLGDVSRLHEAAGADLLLFADAGETFETTAGVAIDIILRFFGGPGPPDEFRSICVALVDRSGRILFVGEGGTLETAMEALPRLR
jgi:hypothetical protein